jgi:hypothetical protein
VWADRFEGAPADVFEFQDEVADFSTPAPGRGATLFRSQGMAGFARRTFRAFHRGMPWRRKPASHLQYWSGPPSKTKTGINLLAFVWGCG